MTPPTSPAVAPTSAVGRAPTVLDYRVFNPRRFNRLEQRDYARRSLACDVWLIDSHTRSVLRCKTEDICDAGLHATAPIGFGLAVGQRYEVRMAKTDGETPRGIPGSLGKSLGYATVIRTEMHVEGGRQDRVGFALRFDAPQLLPI